VQGRPRCFHRGRAKRSLEAGDPGRSLCRSFPEANKPEKPDGPDRATRGDLPHVGDRRFFNAHAVSFGALVAHGMLSKYFVLAV